MCVLHSQVVLPVAMYPASPSAAASPVSRHERFGSQEEVAPSLLLPVAEEEATASL